MSASASAIEAGRAFVKIAVDDLGVKQGLNRVSMTLRSWAATTSKIGLALMGAGTAIVAPLVLAGVQAANYGDSLNDATTRTGLLASEIVGLTHAADLNGTAWDSVETGVKKMQIAVNEAKGGSKEAIDTLAALGVTVASLAGKTQSQQFSLFADQLMKISDPGQRAAAAVKLFGKSGTDLLPMLAGGAAGLKAMQKEADDLGLTLAGNMATSVGDVDDLITSLVQQFVALKTVVGVAIASALRPLIQYAQPIVATCIQWIAANQGLVKSLLWVGAGAIVVGAALVGAGVGATVLLSVIGTLMGAAAAVGGVIAGAFGLLLTPIGAVVAAVGTGVAVFGYFSGYGGQVLNYLGGLWDDLKSTALDAWGGIVAAVGSGDLALAGDIVWAALKLGWAATVGFFKEKWGSVKTFFLTTASDMWYGALAAWEIVSNAFGDAWENTVKFLGDLWGGFKGLVHDGWNSLMDGLEDGWLDIYSTVSGTDRNALKDQADKDRKKRDKDFNDEDMSDSAKRQKDFDKAQADRATAHDAEMAKIGQEAIDVENALKAANKTDSDSLAADLAKKRADLNALIQQAKDEAAGKGKTPPTKPNAPEQPSFDAGKLNQAAANFKASGTFSAAQAAYMFGGGVDPNGKQVADNTKRANVLLAQLVTAMGRTKGPQFG